MSLIGSADAVPALAELLTNSELSQMGRYALERIPDAAASAALREALPKAEGVLKVGVINSLGVRRDADSTPLLVALLDNSDQQIAAAAIAALGAIGSADAAKALSDVQKKATGNSNRPSRTPACLRGADVGRRPETGGDRDLQGVERRGPAQARPPGRRARPACRHRAEMTFCLQAINPGRHASIRLRLPFA